MSITDYRDNGKLVLTPIYLVFGLSAPIWFDLMRFGEIKLSSFAGLASVGIGDSFASIVGKKYGRNRIFRDGKSFEGKRFKKIGKYKVIILNIKRDASSWWSPSLCCHKRNSDHREGAPLFTFLNHKRNDGKLLYAAYFYEHRLTSDWTRTVNQYNSSIIFNGGSREHDRPN